MRIIFFLTCFPDGIYEGNKTSTFITFATLCRIRELYVLQCVVRFARLKQPFLTNLTRRLRSESRHK